MTIVTVKYKPMPIFSSTYAYPPIKMKQCKVCPKQYIHRQSLARHMDQKHQVDSRTHWLLIMWKRLTWRGNE